MALALSEYHRPRDLTQALDLLARPGMRSVPLAGGTDLLGRRDRSIQAVVDLQNLDLAYVRESTDALHIGAMITLQQLTDSVLLHDLAGGHGVRSGGLLARTARSSAPSVLRNQATLGGTLIAAAGSADLPPALLVLGTQVALTTPDGVRRTPDGVRRTPDGVRRTPDGVRRTPDGVRRTPSEHNLSLADFYAQGGSVEGGLLTEVWMPWPSDGTKAAFHKVGRTPTDRAIVCVAAALTLADGICARARLAVGGIGPVPVQLSEVAAALEGQVLAETQFAEAAQTARGCVSPVSDFRASADYRREMVGVLVQRVLTECWNGGEEG